MSVWTTQQRSIPVAAMKPKSRKARKSVTRREHVRGRGGDRGDDRRLPGRCTAVRSASSRAPRAASLEVAGLVQDPDVDAVARRRC